MTSASVPFWSLVDTSNFAGCWPWRGNVDSDGYGVWGRERSHRVAYCQAHQRVLSPIAVVRHTGDNPSCCNPLHLIGGTQLMNVADRVARGRSARGVSNGRSVLSEQQVLEIFVSGEPVAVLVERFGVSRYTIYDIRSGKIWGWLTSTISHDDQIRSHGTPNDALVDAARVL